MVTTRQIANSITLNSANGAKGIGILGGGTVQDASFAMGPTSAVTASVAKIVWVKEVSNPTYPVSGMAGLWPIDKVSWGSAISYEFDSTNAPASTPFSAPSASLLIAAHNTGTDTTMCSLQTIAGVHVSGKEASGVNFITYSGAGLTNVRMKGAEIDVQPGAGTTVIEAFGLGIVAFSIPLPGDYIHLSSNSGGYFSSGIRIDKLDPTIGAGIYAAGTMGSLVNTATGTFGADAIILSNTHKIRWVAASGNNAKAYVDSSNYFHQVMSDAGLAIRNPTDLSTLVYFGPTGNIDIQAGVLQIASLQVLGARKTGWTAATGTATRTTFATGAVTLPQLAEHVKALIDDLIAHGAIGA